MTAFLGIGIYFAAALLHPWSPPHETRLAFSHYAQERFWGTIHLVELLGILLMTATGLTLAWRLRRGASGAWALLAGAAMVAFAAIYAVFAAVDGVALGVLVRRLAAGAEAEQTLFYESAFAVRQVEAGLFALQWFMFAIATGLFAPAFATTALGRRWSVGMCVLSLLASVGALSFAVVQAHTGFSEASMAFQPGLYFGVVWIAAVGLLLLRFPLDEGAT